MPQVDVFKCCACVSKHEIKWDTQRTSVSAIFIAATWTLFLGDSKSSLRRAHEDSKLKFHPFEIVHLLFIMSLTNRLT